MKLIFVFHLNNVYVRTNVSQFYSINSTRDTQGNCRFVTIKMIINKITLHLLSLLLTCLFDISTSFTNIPSTRTISISSSCIVKKQTHHENFFVQTSIMKRSLSMGFLEDVGNSLFGKKSEPIDPSIPTRVLEIPGTLESRRNGNILL